MSWIDVWDVASESPPSSKEIEQIRAYRLRKAKISFYTDENFPTAATRILRTLRVRVTTAQDAGLRRQPDANHAAYALRHGCVLLTCDRDYLDERKFPLIHCPAIVVFAFGSGSTSAIHKCFACLETMRAIPQFFDKWLKIDANVNCWTEYARFLNGTTARTRFRLHNGRIQEWR